MDFEQFKVTGQNVNLASYPTEFDAGLDSDELKVLRSEVWDDLADLQDCLYAENKQSLLLVLQAMDAAGKDSTIGKLTAALTAHGCKVHSFKAPSKLELSHDFLWRVHARAPAAGEFTMFNRSHYEDVLIVKVHGWVSDETIEKRYEHINNFEDLLADRGTKVVKLMLNISKDYQLERFRNRLRKPEKNWKFNPGDLYQREHWDEYKHAFEQAIEKCSSDAAPWYIVPAENRIFRDLMVASIVRNAIKDLNPRYPEPDFDTEKYTVESIK